MEQTGHRDSVTHLDKIADHHCTYHYNDLMTTYLKSLASLPVLLVTGVWREAATRARTRRLVASVQGVIMVLWQLRR